MKFQKEVKKIYHTLSVDELAHYSERNAKLNVEIEDKKREGKNIASEYANKVKTLEAERQEISQKILSKSETREIFCYKRKNYENSTIEFISLEGEIVATEAFRAQDYGRQLEIIENKAISKLERVQYFGMKFFYEEFLKINFEIDVNEEDVEEALEKNRTKFVSTAITYLVEKKVLESFEDSVEFDAMYEVVSGWYNTFKVRYREEPTEEEYKIEEEEKEVEESKDLEEEKPKNIPPKKGSRKGKKGKEEEVEDYKDEEDKGEEDEEDNTPEWMKD